MEGGLGLGKGRRLQMRSWGEGPGLCGYHGNLSSECRPPTGQDNDTTGWEGCGEQVRKKGQAAE